MPGILFFQHFLQPVHPCDRFHTREEVSVNDLLFCSVTKLISVPKLLFHVDLVQFFVLTERFIVWFAFSINLIQTKTIFIGLFILKRWAAINLVVSK